MEDKNKNKFNKIKELYELRTPNQVYEFVELHPFVLQPLIDTHAKIHEIFGRQDRVYLDFYVDLDDPDETGELCVSIPFSLDPDINLGNECAYLNKLDEWFIDLPYKVRKILYTILSFED